MSPPPGNNGGAVSGARPCPVAVGAQNNRTSMDHTHIPQRKRVAFCNVTNFPPAKMTNPRHTNGWSRETAGGQTRCEEAEGPESGKWAERGCKLRYCEQRKLSLGVRRTPASPPLQPGSGIGHAPKRVQKERASLAWSCSNPDHGGRATSNALTCSSSSPALASSWLRSRTHTSRERLRVPSETFA